MDRRIDAYTNRHSLPEYLHYLSHTHPDLYALLSRERCIDAEQYIPTMNRASWEFEDAEHGGRGAAYNVAQKAADNRRTGMTRLLQCFGAASEVPGRGFKILDVLGGDGTIARFCKTLGLHTPTIYTADISRFMIDACNAQGLPCVRQSAVKSLFRDNVLDGVLIAYGSHHLDASARRLAVREAHRTLRAGGRLVLHDFEIGGPCARWFDSVVHPFSRTGHPHTHFSRAEMFELFMTAGFRGIEVVEIADPFTLRGPTAESAKRAAIMHMFDMYDLIKLGDTPGEVVPRLERHIADTLGPVAVRPEGDHYVAEISRHVLVAIGTKPARDIQPPAHIERQP